MGPATGVGRRKLAKVGHWGSALVASDSVRQRGLPTRAQESAPHRPSAKAVREAENEACVGGLRSAWKAVHANSQAAAVGRQLRVVLEEVLEKYPVLMEAVDGGDFDEEAPDQREAMEYARQRIAEALQCQHPVP